MDTTLSHNQRLARKYRGSKGRLCAFEEDFSPKETYIPRYKGTVKEPKKRALWDFVREVEFRLNTEPFVIYETDNPVASINRIQQAAYALGVEIKCVVTVGGVKIFSKE